MRVLNEERETRTLIPKLGLWTGRTESLWAPAEERDDIHAW